MRVKFDDDLRFLRYIKHFAMRRPICANGYAQVFSALLWRRDAAQRRGLDDFEEFRAPVDLDLETEEAAISAAPDHFI